MEETYTFSRARESNMSKKIIIGASVVLVGVILVIGLAVGLVYGLKDDMTYDQQIRLTMDEEDHSKHCCKRLRITGTTNQDDFYQEMMGDYVIYKDYPQLDFTKDPAVAHDVAKHVFPVYTHAMFENDPEVKTAKFAYLYFYYNTEPRKTELECPEGCWIISNVNNIDWLFLKNPFYSYYFQACMT